MTPASWILGETINALRDARRAGAPVSRLVADLRGRGLDLPDVALHLEAAFRLTVRARITMLPKLDSGEPDPRVLDEYVGSQVDAARPQWDAAGAYPDLPRRRDHYAFSAMAQRHGLVLVVCIPVGAAEEYQLHGVYVAETGTNAWTGTRGEHLRAELNLRLGAERIRRGPHDTRAAPAGRPVDAAVRSPQPPVLFFLPDGSIELRTDVSGMERYYRYLGIDWDAYYPPTAAAEVRADGAGGADEQEVD